ncbi:hypothetical protein PsorP6_018847 [Peronosclerospora sorghi]|nr:hypothetical protein PsorP6_018847 [Peronosclerospora sorghi]
MTHNVGDVSIKISTELSASNGEGKVTIVLLVVVMSMERFNDSNVDRILSSWLHLSRKQKQTSDNIQQLQQVPAKTIVR